MRVRKMPGSVLLELIVRSWHILGRERDRGGEAEREMVRER
jgi:hypothetical protein